MPVSDTAAWLADGERWSREVHAFCWHRQEGEGHSPLLLHAWGSVQQEVPPPPSSSSGTCSAPGVWWHPQACCCSWDASPAVAPITWVKSAHVVSACKVISKTQQASMRIQSLVFVLVMLTCWKVSWMCREWFQVHMPPQITFYNIHTSSAICNVNSKSTRYTRSLWGIWKTSCEKQPMSLPHYSCWFFKVMD